MKLSIEGIQSVWRSILAICSVWFIVVISSMHLLLWLHIFFNLHLTLLLYNSFIKLSYGAKPLSFSRVFRTFWEKLLFFRISSVLIYRWFYLYRDCYCDDELILSLLLFTNSLSRGRLKQTTDTIVSLFIFSIVANETYRQFLRQLVKKSCTTRLWEQGKRFIAYSFLSTHFLNDLWRNYFGMFFNDEILGKKRSVAYLGVLGIRYTGLWQI